MKDAIEMAFSARSKSFGISPLERMCTKRSNDVEKYASRAGWGGLPGQQISVDAGRAVNILILSIASDNGLELDAMGQWLPWLRNEALVIMGSDVDNWQFEGTTADSNEFFRQLFANPRSMAAQLLGVCKATAARQCRFHSQSDVECLTNEQFERGHSGRAPKLVIDARDLAARVKAVADGPIFFASAKPSSPY